MDIHNKSLMAGRLQFCIMRCLYNYFTGIVSLKNNMDMHCYSFPNCLGSDADALSEFKACTAPAELYEFFGGC